MTVIKGQNDGHFRDKMTVLCDKQSLVSHNVFSTKGGVMTDKELIYKSNALIEAAYSLTLAEQKIILSAITQVKRNEPITDDVLYLVTANALSDMSGFTAKNEYRALKQATKKLWERTLTVYERPNGEGKKIRQMRWVQEAIYLEDQGAIQIRFSKPILPYLSKLSAEFTKYRLECVSPMSSVYGIRLYELLVQWRSKGEREVTVDWLKQQWELTDKYPSIRDLKRRVIEPALKDINTHSDLWVKCGQRKTGRKVTHLQFKFGSKNVQLIEEKPMTKAKFAKFARPGEELKQAVERAKQEGYRFRFDPYAA